MSVNWEISSKDLLEVVTGASVGEGVQSPSSSAVDIAVVPATLISLGPFDQGLLQLVIWIFLMVGRIKSQNFTTFLGAKVVRTWSKGKGYLAPWRKWLHTVPQWLCWRLFNHGGSRSPRVGQGTGGIQWVCGVGSVCRLLGSPMWGLATE